MVTTTISSIVKGEKDKPGEIRGSIKESKTIGKVYSNTEFGIYANLTNKANLDMPANNVLEVASRDEIKTEPAKIILNIENNIRREYDIEIVKMYKNNNKNNKSMLIKVTDEKLLRTNRWNSTAVCLGAPIIQNNKFIGAVTHVLVNDPTARLWSIR